MQLRDYQLNAADSAIRKLVCENDHGTLLVLPTGTGKTIVFSNVARRWIDGRGERVLVLAHRKELIEQARDKLLMSTDLVDWQVGIERASSRSVSAQPVVVGSVQTLQGSKRLARFPRGAFGLIVIDEAHHVPATGYRKVLNHFGQAKRLGVTATPYRLDGENLGSWFDSYAFQYELAQAIGDGWLVPIVARRVLLEGLDLTRVKRTAGDFNKKALAGVMERRTLVEEVVQPSLEHAGERPTIVFASSVEHARSLVERFNSHRSGCARSVDGSLASTEREAILRDFSEGRFQFLANCELLTEGVDIPRVACVAMARPTQSRALYMQALGRGTRLLGTSLEESRSRGKEDLLVLDFVGLTAKHRAVDVLEVLVPGLPTAAREKAEERLREGGQPLDVAHEEEIRLREQAQPAKPIKVRYQLSAPRDILQLSLEDAEVDSSATDEQVTDLRRLGFSKADRLTCRQAEQVIRALRQRRNLGLCTYKQAIQLRRYGLDPNLTFDEARAAISAIAAANWPRPRSPEFQALGLEGAST